MDIGANTGSYKMLADGAVGAQVVAVEFTPATVRGAVGEHLIQQIGAAWNVMHRSVGSARNAALYQPSIQ